jgi:hypothetical protein
MYKGVTKKTVYKEKLNWDFLQVIGFWAAYK